MAANNPVSIDELQPGMMIVQIDQQNGPVKLRKSGLVKSYDMVKGLKEMGVLTLIIDWENSLEIDTSPAPATPASTVVQTNTRQLFNDEEQSVNNAMSDQFNRSLFLPSLQALPSQFSVWGRYAVQYIGVSVLGLAIGVGIAQLVTPAVENTDDNVSNITLPVDKSIETETPVNSAKTQKAMPMMVDEPVNKQAMQAPKLVNAIDNAAADNPPETDSIDNPPEIDDVENGTLVTQSINETPSVSPVMAAKVNEALAELGGLEELTQTFSSEDNVRSIPQAPAERQTTVEVVDNIPRVSQLPERILVQLPAMVFSAHMYSSTDEDRWVRVNNRRLQEGGNIDANVSVVKIEPQFVVLSFRGTEFKMNALTDW